jgi:hypothetical protein
MRGTLSAGSGVSATWAMHLTLAVRATYFGGPKGGPVLQYWFPGMNPRHFTYVRSLVGVKVPLPLETKLGSTARASTWTVEKHVRGATSKAGGQLDKQSANMGMDATSIVWTASPRLNADSQVGIYGHLPEVHEAFCAPKLGLAPATYPVGHVPLGDRARHDNDMTKQQLSGLGYAPQIGRFWNVPNIHSYLEILQRTKGKGVADPTPQRADTLREAVWVYVVLGRVSIA